jgi:hypothetical protein
MAEVFYKHDPNRLERYLRGIYKFICESREKRKELHPDGTPSVQPLPPFEIWVGNEGQGEINKWRDYTPAVDPRLN